MSTSRGFTIIELLVVIAIIGVMSAIVLASLNSARVKGYDASVRSNLRTIMTQSAVIYDLDGDFDAVCAANSVAWNTVSQNAFNAAVAAAGSAGVCGKPASGVANAYAVSVPLRIQNQFGASSGTDHWCVDSTGQVKVIDNAIAATATVCP